MQKYILKSHSEETEWLFLLFENQSSDLINNVSFAHLRKR